MARERRSVSGRPGSPDQSNLPAGQPKSLAVALPVETFRAWQQERTADWAAALAFYAMLSVCPLLLLVIAMAGALFGREVASETMMQQLAQLMGQGAADGLAKMLARTQAPGGGFWPSVFSTGTLLFGATGIFGALQDAMDDLWHVRPRPGSGLRLWLKRRFLSATMVGGLSFLLMVSLAIDGVLAACWATFPGRPWFAAQALHFAVSWLLGTLLVAATFVVLPDARVAKWAVAIGAAITALLLAAGKFVIGRYLGLSGVADPFGAAGSLAIVLLWTYYAAQLLFVGAIFTRVLAKQAAGGVRPGSDSVPV